MQSGFKRKSYDVGPCPPDAPNRAFSSGSKRKERCITGLATDALNSVLIASTLDGTINVRILYFCPNQTTLTIDVQVLRFPNDETRANPCVALRVRIVDSTS
jgi:U3 small nucleolar RNA-associated protein 21